MTRPLKPRTSRLAPRLVVEKGSHQGEELIIRKPLTIVGRNESCDIVIDDPLVSRRHCQIAWDGVYCTIEDVGSTNGTFVNGQLLSMVHALQSGDKLQVADTTFRFTDPQATTAARKWPRLHIERAAKRALVNDTPVELSVKEYALLIYLDDHSDRISSKGEIAKAVWPEYKGDVFDYQVESLVKRLRQKLEPGVEESHFVMTMRGRGYRLVKR